jgi:hypothetical protein
MEFQAGKLKPGSAGMKNGVYYQYIRGDNITVRFSFS